MIVKPKHLELHKGMNKQMKLGFESMTYDFFLPIIEVCLNLCLLFKNCNSIKEKTIFYPCSHHCIGIPIWWD